ETNSLFEIVLGILEARPLGRPLFPGVPLLEFFHRRLGPVDPVVYRRPERAQLTGGGILFTALIERHEVAVPLGVDDRNSIFLLRCGEIGELFARERASEIDVPEVPTSSVRNHAGGLAKK